MKFLLMIGLILVVTSAVCQDTAERKKIWTIAGYIKELAWMRLDEYSGNTAITSLLHNRLNTKFTPSETWSGRLEVRNRFYWGQEVSNNPGFKNQLRNNGEAVNLSVNWFNTNSTVLHSNVERLWMEFRKTTWNIRAGRQRINWGLCNTWNPNDLFNSYNFLDFDYEERPGSDAAKAQYMVGELSTIEAVFADNGYNNIVATKYSTNVRQYDLQVNTGWYEHTFTAGFGWAGSIADAGFKGEIQYYANQAPGLSNLLVSLEGDYIFKNGMYISSAFLYNQKGLKTPLSNPSTLLFQPSPRAIMPTKWNILISSSKEFTPLLNTGLSIVYAPGTNLLIVYSTLRYNVKTNWDFDLVWQSFFAETTRFEPLLHAGYLRLRFNF